MKDPVPRISILLPNLNQRPFLAERLDSVFNQTFPDWELIVIDGFSTDGSWDYLWERCTGDSRIRLQQSPPRGVYQAWNECLEMAGGEFVYFATSDDTMAPDCLQKMVEGLDRHPECGLAHCCLRIIDEEGRILTGPDSWEEQPAQKYYLRDKIQQEHVRPAPHDGLLHCVTGTVYTSITQLLLRRSIFQEAGGFRGDWGAPGDFEWGMRVSLLYHTLHLPEYLASWRRHANQLTDDQKSATPAARRKMAAMAGAALQSASSLRKNLPDLSPFRKWTQPFRHQALLCQRKSVAPWLRPPLILWQWLREPDLIGLDFSSLIQWKGRYRFAHRAWLFREMSRLGITPWFTLD